MNFPSVEIQGSIISADLLGKIRSEQAKFQYGKDFDKSFTNPKLKDEISLAWQDAKGQWVIFQNKLKRLTERDAAAAETRNFWILPLLSNFGYDFQFLKTSEELNGKTFWINTRDNSIGGFPLFIAGYNESIDKRPENKSIPVSPHALVQEYLNYSEHLYGLVTNGRQIRLLRDASRLTRLSYIEFNLQKIMEEDLYSDFVILYRLLHKSRMPQQQEGGADSIIERYHQDSLEEGATIRNKLGAAVKDSIKAIANGFVNHPDNLSIRKVIKSGQFESDEYYRHLLRIVYRLLFLFVIEERNLVYGDSKDPQIRRFHHIYFNFYSLLKLRKYAKQLPPPDASRYYDLWLGIISTFALFEDSTIGKKMGIMSLKGDLFSYNAIANDLYDLHKCRLGNDIILQVIKALCYFENDQGVLVAVNYGGLDVEEFGSVYEGLLELKLKIDPVPASDTYVCSFDGSAERSISGSHYTPEELVQPLIKHSLEYLIEDRAKPYYNKKASKSDTIQKLLDLKVCDVACGSGHILLSAARRIALEIARVQTDEEQPNPVAVRKALREVIHKCIYGVDKNPLAVELCKVAFWLEAHNPGEPLNFLDHHIKCGDALVGLAHKEELEKGIAEEAFKALPGDEKGIAGPFAKRNKEERMNRSQVDLNFELTLNERLEDVQGAFNQWVKMPENSPEAIDAKSKAYEKLTHSGALQRLKMLADIQVGQFFIPKTTDCKEKIVTDGSYFRYLKGEKPIPKAVLNEINELAARRFFHWFLEFPEVFIEGGFHCVLGNPPFLGGQKLTGYYGDNYLEYIKYQYAPIRAVDLVTYFFKRIFSIVRAGSFQSLISTNTIAQGKAREDGLDQIVKNGGTINHAVKSIKWPGQAAVEVSLITITKQHWKRKFVLSGKEVHTITPYLDDAESLDKPYPLIQNEGKSFQGSIVLGKGFVLETEEAEALIKKNAMNKDVLFPYLSGDDLNSKPDQEPGRWVINFFDWPEEKAKRYLDVYTIVKKLVKPERQRLEKDKNGKEIPGKFALRKPLPEKWWIYGEKRPALYSTIKSMSNILVINNHTRHHCYSFASTDIVFSHALTIIASEDKCLFAILSSTIMDVWAWWRGSTMGSTTLRYTPTQIFETFPFVHPIATQQERELRNIGGTYYEHRKKLMLSLQLGLTPVYNLFHNKAIAANENINEKELSTLQKHLEKNTKRITLDHAIKAILTLRDIQIRVDNAVLNMYDWNDIQLKHGFYDVDHLPEDDRSRFTIHPEARKEILKRLLMLNHQMHTEETKMHLSDMNAKKKKTKSSSKSRPGGLFD